MTLQIRYRVDLRPSAPVQLGLGKSVVSLERELNAAPVGEWRTLKLKLACFRRDGEDLAAVATPVSIRTSGRLGLSISELRLGPNQNDGGVPMTCGTARSPSLRSARHGLAANYLTRDVKK